jgi:hypothetical protein
MFVLVFVLSYMLNLRPEGPGDPSPDFGQG